MFPDLLQSGSNKRSKFEDFMDTNTLDILCDGYGTRIFQNDNHSSLNVTLVFLSVALHSLWSIMDTDCVSDHFPVSYDCKS